MNGFTVKQTYGGNWCVEQDGIHVEEHRLPGPDRPWRQEYDPTTGEIAYRTKVGTPIAAASAREEHIAFLRAKYRSADPHAAEAYWWPQLMAVMGERGK